MTIETKIPHEPVEYFSEPELWVNNAMNNPAKLVTLIALSGAGEPLSKGQIDREVRALCEGPVPYSDGVFYGYCKTMAKTEGVRNADALALVSMHPRIVDGFETTALGDSDGLALAGLALDWQIRNPRLPLQRLLGSSSSKVEGSAFAPTFRMLALADLVEQDDNPRGPAIEHLARVVKSSNSAKQATTNTWVAEGFVDVKSQKIENEREFTITNPSYNRKGRQPRFEHLKPETQLIYNALGIAKKIRDNWKVDEFLRLAEGISGTTDPAIMKKVRLRLQNGLAPSTSNFKDSIQASSGQLYEGWSMVKLKPEFLEPIAELVAIFDGFAGKNPEFIQRGHRLARSLYNDPAALGWLMRYSYEISAHTEPDFLRQQRILEIIEENPGLTTKEITEKYSAVKGKKVGTRVVLASLAEDLSRDTSRTEHQSVRATPIKDTKHRVYYPKTLIDA